MKKKMINIGVIGCGYWGPNLIRNFSALPNCHVKIVSDLKPGRLEFIKNEFPALKTSKNYEDIINDPDLDAIAIVTPVPTHRKIAEEALKSGKHVFVEKPLASTSKDAQDIVDIAKEMQRKVAVGHVFQFAPAVRKIRELIVSGTIGDVLHITSTRINLGPPDSDVDVIWDLGAHDFSIILYWMGQSPIKLNSFKNSYPFNAKLSEKITKITNNAHIDIQFGNGVTSHIHLSWLSSNKTRLMQIFGTKGTIVYDEMLALDGKVKLYDTGVDNRISNKDSDSVALKYQAGDIHVMKLEQHEPLRMECEHFVNAVLEDVDLINDGKIGLEVVKLIELSSN